MTFASMSGECIAVTVCLRHAANTDCFALLH